MSDGSIIVDVQEDAPWLVEVTVPSDVVAVDVVAGAMGPAGPAGAAGAMGPAGAPGPQGPVGPAPGLTIITPATGATVTLIDLGLVFVNTAALAALTIKLPPSPVLSNSVEIGFLSPVTALTVQNSAGAAVATAPTSAYGPGAALVFKYTSIGWVYWK